MKLLDAFTALTMSSTTLPADGSIAALHIQKVADPIKIDLTPFTDNREPWTDKSQGEVCCITSDKCIIEVYHWEVSSS